MIKVKHIVSHRENLIVLLDNGNLFECSDFHALTKKLFELNEQEYASMAKKKVEPVAA